MNRVTVVGRPRALALVVCALIAYLLAIPFAATASVFYRFDVVAQTGQNNIVSLGTGPSINDKGKVAYVGRFSNGPSVFAWSPVTGSTDIATSFLSPNRSFGEAVRMNRNDEVLTWNRLLPLGLYEVRVFRPATPNDSSVMVRGISGGQPYDLLYQNPAMNSTRVLEDDATALAGNKDGVCDAGETCVSQVAFNAFRSTPARFLGTVVQTPQDAADGGQRNEFSLNVSQSHPMMADDGRVVIRGVNPTDSILLFNYNLAAPTTIAGAAGGFTQLGASPGITTDGKIVAFAADRGHGAGIFLSIEGAGGARKVFRIAGENATVQHRELGVDGAGNPLYFNSLDVDSRVGIVYTPNSVGVPNQSIVVSFIGTPNAASRTNPGTGKPFLFSAQKGLWTIRIDLDADLYKNVCLVRLPNGGILPTPGGDDQVITVTGQQPYIDAGANGVCETENTYGTEGLFSRSSPLPVVQVGDKIGPGGSHTVADIAVNDPIAQANFDVALIPRTARQGDHRIAFWASIDGGAGQMIVAGDHLDSDQDGLLDHWETQGIDLDGTGSIDLDLPALGANPFKRDLFVQIDWSADRPQPLNYSGKHRPTVGLMRQLAQFFASAPARLDGIPPGVMLHVDAGTGVDAAGQPFSRNMGIGPLVGGQTIGGGPVDILYFGQPNSVTLPNVHAVSFDTAKNDLLWSHNRGARELAFLHLIYADFHHATNLAGDDDNVNPVQAAIVAADSNFEIELPPAFNSSGLLNKGIKITSGAGAGQVRQVSSVAIDGITGNVLLDVATPFAVQPDSTSTLVTFDASSGQGNAGDRLDGAFNAGRDLAITLGIASATPNAEWSDAYTLYKTMQHEMGHLFTLMHGGVDHDNYKPTYVSVLNYAYQLCPPGAKGHGPGHTVLPGAATCPIDYSAASDAISDNWKHLDLRFNLDFGRLGQAFGTDTALVVTPYPPAPEISLQQLRRDSDPLDVTAPVAAITAPLGGASFTVGSSIAVTGAANDDVAVTRGEIAFDVNGDGTVDDTEIFTATFTPPGSFSFTLPPVSGPSGTRKLALIAYDAVGNPGVASVAINIGAVPPATVPGVTGLALDVATTALTNATFALGAVTYQQSPSVPAGSVVSQSIAAGTSQPPGTPVALVVSLGANGTQVPALKGLSQAAAIAALNNAGLVMGIVTAVTTPDPTGVLSQFPLPGTIVAAGSAVQLLVNGAAGSISVPNVVGLTQAAATTAITSAGLVVGAVTQQASNTVPAGSVISQNPTAGQLVAAGSAVDLVISTGPAQVSVPNVVGLTQAAATAAITNAGLVVGTVTQQASSIVPAGNVISQNPLAGQLVNLASAVNLVVSTGPAQVSVPNVVGFTQAAATTAITNAGLVVGTITQQASTIVPAGSVISQNPLAGQLVNLGSAVNLVISTGPAQVSVPSVVGLTQAAATTAITNAGLVVGTITQQTSATVPAGSVIAQTPTAGQLVALGSAVDLVVSLGPPVVVPVFTGQTQADAIAAIIAAGLQVGNVSLQPSNTVPAGIVLAQNPPAGQQVPPGSRIDLVVSSGVAPLDVPTLSPALLAVLALLIAGTVWMLRRRRR